VRSKIFSTKNRFQTHIRAIRMFHFKNLQTADFKILDMALYGSIPFKL
jgi:hypothetical protein